MRFVLEALGGARQPPATPRPRAQPRPAPLSPFERRSAGCRQCGAARPAAPGVAQRCPAAAARPSTRTQRRRARAALRPAPPSAADERRHVLSRATRPLTSVSQSTHIVTEPVTS
eukprot:359345-Chlamydomonas_euryale.AAC.2